MSQNYWKLGAVGYPDRIRALGAIETMIPEPRWGINNVKDFLTALGMNCVEYESKFESWESLFKLNMDTALNEKNIDLTRARHIVESIARFK